MVIEINQQKLGAALIEIGGKFYICRTFKTVPRGRLPAKEVFKYEEIDKEEYLARINKLAELIASAPGVRLKDVIKDALMEYTLDVLEDIEKDIGEAIKEAGESKEPVALRISRGTVATLSLARRL